MSENVTGEPGTRCSQTHTMNRRFTVGCRLRRGHEGDHEDRFGNTWPQEARPE